MKTDEQLQRDIVEELKWEPSATLAKVGVFVCKGEVTLRGMVASYAEKCAVEHAAQRVDGVIATINELTIIPSGSHERADAEIAEDAMKSLKCHVWVPSGIQVTVAQGWVTLQGNVNWEFQRTASHDSVCMMPGVKGVTNEIKLKTPSPISIVKNPFAKSLHRKTESDHDLFDRSNQNYMESNLAIRRFPNR